MLPGRLPHTACSCPSKQHADSQRRDVTRASKSAPHQSSRGGWALAPPRAHTPCLRKPSIVKRSHRPGQALLLRGKRRPAQARPNGGIAPAWITTPSKGRAVSPLGCRKPSQSHLHGECTHARALSCASAAGTVFPKEGVPVLVCLSVLLPHLVWTSRTAWKTRTSQAQDLF
jgi:hypothetical protein